ncbi:MAG: hypothetical protein M3R10_03010 [Verrucomicrobiota bacterium]|nr:hypothetical protein [Verrucomicrobiota bacterium]
MALPKAVALVAERLNSVGAIWMTTGSIAAMTYGDYRVTNDVDIVLTLAPAQCGNLAAAFSIEEFYCPPLDVIATEAGRPKNGHFNLIHHDTGFKADLYFAGDDELAQWAFRHRQPVEFDRVTIWIGPPEYVIIGKLEFFREGGSEKHLRDIRGMLAVTEVDRALIESEVQGRGLALEWRRCVD